MRYNAKIKMNYYALLAAIFTEKSVNDVLREFGLIDYYEPGQRKNDFVPSEKMKKDIVNMHDVELMPINKIAKVFHISDRTIDRIYRETKAELGEEVLDLRKLRRAKNGG